jgi:hypothetical protein
VRTFQHRAAFSPAKVEGNRHLSTPIRMASIVTHDPQCRSDLSRVRAVVLAGEGDGGNIAVCFATKAWTDAPRHIDDRTALIIEYCYSVPRAILAGVEAVTAQSMRHHCFGLVVLPTHPARVEAMRYISGGCDERFASAVAFSSCCAQCADPFAIFSKAD